MKNIIELFKAIITAGSGISSTRVGFMNMVLMIWIIIIATIFMIFNKIIITDIYGITALIGVLAGIFGAVKYAQKKVEVNGDKNITTENNIEKEVNNDTK